MLDMREIIFIKAAFSSLFLKVQLIPQHRLCSNRLFKLSLYSQERYKIFCKMMCPEACMFFSDISVGLIKKSSLGKLCCVLS